jgi:hypothetical protein
MEWSCPYSGRDQATSWRFPPPRINGKKVKVNYVYRVNFSLD